MTTFWNRWLERQSRLRRLAVRWMGGHRPDAEDALSDAALRAVEKLRTAPPDESLDAWMDRLLFTVCMDRHRGRRSRARLEERVETDPALLGNLLDSPEETLLLRERSIRLAGALDRLPADLRGAVSLRCHGRSYAEIATAFGITAANARKRVQLGKALAAELV